MRVGLTIEVLIASFRISNGRCGQVVNLFAGVEEESHLRSLAILFKANRHNTGRTKSL